VPFRNVTELIGNSGDTLADRLRVLLAARPLLATQPHPVN
jgi:hypothetical protein